MKTIFSIVFKATCFILIFFSTFDSFSQEMQYSYDAAGNRIKKQIVLGDGPGEDLEPGFNRLKPVFEDVLSDQIIKIYPNPTKGVLRIELSDELIGNSSVRLISSSGKVIQEKMNNQKLMVIDFTEQAKGNYILQLIKEDELSNWKIIKK